MEQTKLPVYLCVCVCYIVVHKTFTVNCIFLRALIFQQIIRDIFVQDIYVVLHATLCST